ncbi:MRPL40 54S ribosomal protein L40 [Candida maltosa Xu316]
MSWVRTKSRFQRNIENYKPNIKKHFDLQNEKGLLPTFRGTFPETISKSKRKTPFQAGIIEGDMAYVTKGPHKGKIAQVLQYSSEFNAVSLSGISSKKLIPKTFWGEGQTSHVFDYPDYIPRENVRVVGKERDENGDISYIVAEDVDMRDSYYDDRYKKFIPRRFIKHHSKIEIPWPTPAEETDGELSTAPNVAMEKTYEFQSIARSGTPKAALSQLRNPFSKYKKKKLSGFQVAKLNGPEMPLTIEQKIWVAKSEAQAAENAKRVYQPLSDEVQEFIGSKMADHMNKIESPALRYHLEVLASKKDYSFAQTMEKIEKKSSETTSETTTL